MSFLNDLVDVGLVVVGAATGQYWIAAIGIADYQRRDAKRRAKNQYNDQQKDRQQMVQSATAARSIVYGRARVSGPLVYAQSTGSQNEYMHLVIALAGHECDAIEQIWFNDVALPAPDANGFIQSGDYCKTNTLQASVQRSGNGTITLSGTPTRIIGATYWNGSLNAQVLGVSLSGNVVTITGVTGTPLVTVVYEYTTVTPLVRIKSVLGTATQSAFSDLVSESGGKWTTVHALKGICAIYVRLQFDADIFNQGLPSISAVVRGKKVYDPRTGLTAWSANSALCAADYLRTTMSVPASQIPDAELTVEANVCDQTVAVDALGTTQARYSCNGVLGTDVAPRDNLDAITESMAGEAIWSQGRWLLRSGYARSSVLTITESMLALLAFQPAGQSRARRSGARSALPRRRAL
jgi:hypothetical protein